MSDPNNSVGFIQEYPQRLREIERQKALGNPEPTEQLLSREEAARFLKISLSTLDRQVKAKQMPVVFLGRRVVFLKSSLEAHLRNMQVLPDATPFYEPEIEMTYQEAKEVEKKSGRLVEVSRLLQSVAKKEMSGAVNNMTTFQREEFFKMKKALWQEFDFLSKDLDRLEQLRLERFKKRVGLSEEKEL